MVRRTHVIVVDVIREIHARVGPCGTRMSRVGPLSLITNGIVF